MRTPPPHTYVCIMLKPIGIAEEENKLIEATVFSYVALALAG